MGGWSLWVIIVCIHHHLFVGGCGQSCIVVGSHCGCPFLCVDCG